MAKGKLNYQEFFIRNLPHYQPKEGIFAVTFRLAFTIPNKIINILAEEKKQFDFTCNDLSKDELILYKKEFSKKYFSIYDHFIGKYKTKNEWLKKKEVAKIISDAIFYHSEKKYKLFCFCIMPNHVHLILEPSVRKNEYYSISEILHSIKGFSANKANKLLKRKGQFWEHGHYDHVIRNENDFCHQINYLIMNPVKAGLVENWKDWDFTYLAEGIEL